MNRIVICAVSLLAVNISARAQESITLPECFAHAEANHRLAEEKERFASIFELSSAILKKAWMPSADAGASFVYNSDVVDLSSALAGIPFPGIADAISPIPHSQYRITLDISQMIYDGGTTKVLARSKEAEMKISQQLTEIEIYGIKERVIANFFGIILLDNQYDLIKGFMETVESRIRAAVTAVEAGMMTQSDHDMLLAEKYKLRQQADENRIMSSTLRKILSDIAGIEVNDSTILIAPVIDDIPAGADFALSRPELKLYDMTTEQLATGEMLIDAGRRPRAFGFATAGYGNPPGNNFFIDSFEPYFVAGASLKWNIYDWNKAKHEREILSVRKEITLARKADSEARIARLLETKRSEIANLERAVETGDTLVALRTGITAVITSKFGNGTITAYEYIAGVNAEQEAIIAREINKLSLTRAKTEFMFISGLELK